MSLQLDRVEQKLESISNKLDSHLERITRTEVKVDGFIKLGVLLAGALISSVVRLYIK